MPAAVVDSRSRSIRVAFVVAFAGLLLFAGQELLQLEGHALSRFTERWLYVLIEAAAVLLTALGAVRSGRDRRAWLLLAAGLALWTVGEAVWTFALESLPAPPYPSVADFFYVLGYAAFFIAVSRMLTLQFRQTAIGVWLDGAVVGLTLAAVGWALVMPSVLAHPGTSEAASALNATYVVLDLMLLAGVALGFAVSAWRPGRTLGLLALAFGTLAVTDLLFLYEEAIGSTVLTHVLNVLWPAVMMLVALAAWQPFERARTYRRRGRSTVYMPAAFSLCSLAILVLASSGQVDAVAVGFAAAALLLAGTRGVLTYLENFRMLELQTRDAVTDALTGLGNRRALINSLSAMVDAAVNDGGALTLCFFDLNGFKHYNDTFGHAAGDELLRRLGDRLETAVGSLGRPFRLGGDEFCVLLEGRFSAESEDIRALTAAFNEQGSGFNISAACGVVSVPDDAADMKAALALADRRMYRDKERTSRSGRAQIQSVLMRVVDEREPALSAHTREVGTLAVEIARRLGVKGEELDEIWRAAELHDVGKLAIPDTILNKPGPLDANEWHFMRQHTLIGERILSVAPAMANVARLVRSTHERWDGSGYPDRLAADAIPLGARIISVCDAFTAITATRAYEPARTPEEAMRELQANSGTQFDPRVVAALCEHLAQERIDGPPAVSDFEFGQDAEPTVRRVGLSADAARAGERG